jgi:hypothetical protein
LFRHVFGDLTAIDKDSEDLVRFPQPSHFEAEQRKLSGDCRQKPTPTPAASDVPLTEIDQQLNSDGVTSLSAFA